MTKYVNYINMTKKQSEVAFQEYLGEREPALQRLREALSRKITAVREELQDAPQKPAYQAVYPGRVRTVAPSRNTVTST